MIEGTLYSCGFNVCIEGENVLNDVDRCNFVSRRLLIVEG
jgi:hypothetical protein